jgi:formamidopyrimidine-DNA glycosylase
MPIELPEAAIIGKQMQAELVGRRVAAVRFDQRAEHLLKAGHVNLHQVDLRGMRVIGVQVLGKWLIVDFDSGICLLLSLEVDGKILFHAEPNGLAQRYHMRIDFADGSALTLWIIGWGLARAMPAAEMATAETPGPPGISPYDPAFSEERFVRLMRGAHGNIKAALLDQSRILGIGNAYIQDILFKARLHPRQKVARLDEDELAALYDALRHVLCMAREQGGRIGEYDLYNRPGAYAMEMGQHLKGGNCPVCGGPVRKMQVERTASYVCEVCQPR